MHILSHYCLLVQPMVAPILYHYRWLATNYDFPALSQDGYSGQQITLTPVCFLSFYWIIEGKHLSQHITLCGIKMSSCHKNFLEVYREYEHYWHGILLVIWCISLLLSGLWDTRKLLLKYHLEWCKTYILL